MFFELSAALYILSNICCVCIATENPIALLKALHKEHCGYVTLCNTNVTTPAQTNRGSEWTTPQYWFYPFISITEPTTSVPSLNNDVNSAATSQVTDVKGQNHCCLGCSCSDDCRRYGNCCLDKTKEAQNETLTAVESELIDSSFACMTPQLITGHSFVSRAPSYYMVNTCRANAIGNRQIVKCTSDYVTDFLLDVTPVYIPRKNVLYKNAHCVSCNFGNANRGISLDPVLLCRENVIQKITRFETPDQVIDFLRQSQSPECNIMFKFPRDVESSNKEIEILECDVSDIKSCNVTGLWRNYNKTLEKACETYFQPILGVPPSTEEHRPRALLVYQNLACYECNKGEASTSLECEDTRVRKEVELRLHVITNDLGFSGQRPAEESGKTQCDNGLFFDIHQRKFNNTHVLALGGLKWGKPEYLESTANGRPLLVVNRTLVAADTSKQTCRDVVCPLGQYKSGAHCQPIFKETKFLKYQLTIKMFLKLENLKSFAKRPGIIPGELLAFLNQIGNEFSVCTFSAWAKANGKQSEIIFNIILTGDMPLQYNVLLGRLNFLRGQEIKDGNFHFADHIYFSDGGRRAIDLTDNAELLNLKYSTPLNKEPCLYPLAVTEMHVCERVKLNADEFEITDKTLYLKHSQRSLYGHEFFLDGKNQTSVCVDKYNMELEQNDVKIFKVVDQTGEKNEGVTTDKDITKDFGFFIGCLALLALFISMALAKKKYQNYRRKHMGELDPEEPGPAEGKSQNGAIDANISVNNRIETT